MEGIQMDQKRVNQLLQQMYGYVSTFSRAVKSYVKVCSGTVYGNDLSPHEIEILSYLFRKGENGYDTAKDIVELMGISKSLVCRTVDSLIRKGYLHTEKDRKDRRILHLHLTPQAEKILPALSDLHYRFVHTALKGVQPDDLQTFYEVFDRIVKNVSNVPDEDYSSI